MTRDEIAQELAEQRQRAGELVTCWNIDCPVGTPVEADIGGEQVRTTTASAAWCLHAGHPVVRLAGQRGVYSLFRVRPVRGDQ